MWGEFEEEMDIAMSQIDTVLIQQMEQEIQVDEDLEIPAELLKEYEKAMNGILPSKSRNRYNQAYEVFKKWQCSYGTTSFDEKVVMAYFSAAAEKYQPSTLWSMYSMLKKTLIVKHNVNLKNYCQLIAWLKTKSDGYQPKQSNVFTTEELQKFVTDAPNELYFGMKVVLAFGVLGASRGIEITNLLVDNVKDNGIDIEVRVPDTKTKKPKLFVVDGEFTNIVREYMKMRPTNAGTNRFFLQYRNGKLTRQVMGKHSIAQIPKKMAMFLQLPDPASYTGHSYRRTGTTIAADSGASIEDLKRLGQWESTKSCERYIQNSVGYKQKLAKLISGSIDLPSTSTSAGAENESAVPSKKLGVSGASKTLDTIRIPENKENIVFQFMGECNNFTISYK